MILSGTLPWEVGLDDHPGVLSGVPVFYGRSDDDPVIPADLITRTRTWPREESGAAVVEPAYHGFGHGISAQELRDFSGFLSEALSLAPNP